MFNTFKGGIHPPRRKALTENLSIENLSVPQVCHIPMLQHTGVPAKLMVKTGDLISEGQLIGEAQGLVSANVHASVPGKVIDILESLTVNGMQTTVVIEAEGAFTTTGSSAVLNDWMNIDKSALLCMVRDSGIVGLGGTGNPASVTLNPSEKANVDTLIVDGTECEPYLTADDVLMRTYPSEIIEGIQITLKILGIKKAIIAVEDDKKKSINALKEALKKKLPEEDITVKQLRSKYPIGAEKQLVYSVLKRVINSGNLPEDSGVVVQSIGTIYAIREAVLFNKPLIDRYITVSGDMIKRPGNYKIRFGTTISEVADECGGLNGVPSKIIMGGPMCGTSVESMEIPVVKSTTGILFLSENETNSGDFNSCIRCGRCVSVCPIGLIPCKIAGAAEKGRLDLISKLHVDACILCGSCSYICPSKRPLGHYMKMAQESLSQQK